ncbi:MAG TPA: 6-bladed beta-propeller [Edaphocola sp.]|nr:6-bladed beta-propeller [Edaphocola sp.]
MYKIIFISALFLILIAACTNLSNTPEFLTRKGGNSYCNIDLDMNNIASIPIDSLVRDVKFIRLETSKECMISSYDKILVLKDTIYILDKTQLKAVFAFDMQGRFLYKISALGRGPGEYVRAYDFYVDTVDSHIGILDYGKVQKYNFKGEHIGQVSFSGNVLAYFCYYSGKYNGACLDKFTKDKSYIFAQYDSIGNLIYRDHPTSNDMLKSELGKSNYFTSNSEGGYFNDFGADTIYRITNSFLEPAFVLDYGNSALPLNTRNELITKDFDEKYSYFKQNQNTVRFGLRSMSISENYLLLELPYGNSLKTVLFSLNTHAVKFLDNYINYHHSILRCLNGSFSGEYVVGNIGAAYISSLNQWNYDDLKITKREIEHPFFYQNIDDYKDIKETDNGIICIFSFDEF